MAAMDYADVQKSFKGRTHLLLGNGFSIGCDPIFKYQSLYDVAVEKGLSPNAQAVFGRFGTNNFEGVMRVLMDANWVGQQYGLLHGDDSELLKDVEIVRRALVAAIAESHLDYSGSVSDEMKESASAFFYPFYNIFTTNYDLVAYWIVMAGGPHPKYWDGFGEDLDEPDADHVVFSFHVGNHPGIFYMHGALHLYVKEGVVAKHCWSRTGEKLTKLIKAGMADGRNPLFVAEGTSGKKLEQIHTNSYLSYALSKLNRIEGTLVVLGHSLSSQDQHLRDIIAGNKKLKRLFIGVRDAANPAKAKEAVASIELRRDERGHEPLEVQYFTSDSAKVWP
ncbi:MAG: hypothetical protein JWL71_1246 [Acidobacteria bacterium]|nr:hypothetical protein [Acidobacteriota bacterium]